jgi:hypothetical protein
MERDVNKNKLVPASLLALLALVVTFSIAFAHEHTPVGHYELVIGWASEPAVAGQPNAITIRVEDTAASDKEKEVDVSKLTAVLAYGGQTKPLTLEKSFGTTNEYEAHLIPGIAGTYSLQLRGKVGDVDVNVDVEPEEVAAVDSLVFPSIPAAPQAQPAMRLGDWLGIGALVIALAALVLAIRKPRS